MLKVELEYETPINPDHYQNEFPNSIFDESSVDQTIKIMYTPTYDWQSNKMNKTSNYNIKNTPT